MEYHSVLELVFIVVYSLVVSYLCYMAWFKPEKALLNARKAVTRIPKWYPFKWLAQDSVNNPKSWIKINRIGVTFIEIYVFIFLVYYLIRFTK